MGNTHFYNSGCGTALVDDQNYPLEIKEYLGSEERFLTTLSKDVKMLIEVGCMYGRFLEWARDHKLRYLGIDVAPQLIRAGYERMRQSMSNDRGSGFLCGDACHLDVHLLSSGARQTDALAFYPFNCIGNIQEVERAIMAIARAGVRFFISTYKNDLFANMVRSIYYCNCGYREISRSDERQGCRFTSVDGLDTMSYDHLWFEHLLSRYGLTASVIPLGRVGIGYYGVGNSKTYLRKESK